MVPSSYLRSCQILCRGRGGVWTPSPNENKIQAKSETISDAKTRHCLASCIGRPTSLNTEQKFGLQLVLWTRKTASTVNLVSVCVGSFISVLRSPPRRAVAVSSAGAPSQTGQRQSIVPPHKSVCDTLLTHLTKNETAAFLKRFPKATWFLSSQCRRKELFIRFKDSHRHTDSKTCYQRKAVCSPHDTVRVTLPCCSTTAS